MATERIMYVVNDDPAIREPLAVLLQTVGIDARVFGTAEALLTTLADNEPICALVDIFLPGMNELWLQQRLVDRGIQAPLIS
jgi:FixJ family two-component response regulator